MPIYMKIDGIDGQVTVSGYENTIEVQSLSWGASSAVSSAQNGQRSASSVVVTDIMVTKPLDKSSVNIFDAQIQANSKSAKISFVTNNDTENFAYYEIELEDVYFSNYTMSSGGDRPIESLGLSFGKIKETFTPTDATGQGSPVRVGYDVTTNKKI